MREGDTVQEFELLDQSGSTVRLGDLVATGPLVLFFYPRAISPGCTRESCHFRDLKAEFSALGATVAGVSSDPVDRQDEFDRTHDLGFPLLSDPDREVARQFGVLRPGPLPARRSTFVIDSSRRVVAVIRSEINMMAHADRSLESLRAVSEA